MAKLAVAKNECSPEQKSMTIKKDILFNDVFCWAKYNLIFIDFIEFKQNTND